MPKRQKNLYLESEDAEFIESFPDKKANQVVKEAIQLLKQGVKPEVKTPLKHTLPEVRIIE